jgi:hypothetical protein
MGEGDEPEIGRSVEDLLDHPVRVQVLDFDPGVRIVRHEPLDVLAHVPEPHRVDRRDPDGPGHPLSQVAHRGFDRLVLVDELPASVVIRLSLAGKGERPTRAVHEKDAEAFFELVHDLADGGLRDPVRLGGRGEAPLPGDVAEHLDRLELHGAYPTIQRTNVKKMINYGF